MNRIGLIRIVAGLGEIDRTAAKWVNRMVGGKRKPADI